MREEQLGQELVEVNVRSKDEYRPSRKEALCTYEIRIRFLGRGCIVSVGCQEIAFESVETAMAAINLYVANPYDEQQKWRKILY